MSDDHKAKMAPRADSPPGLETDGHGNVIPLEQRTQEDQDKARGAAAYDGTGKNPENQAGDPAPMPRATQGQGGKPVDRDLAGQQGGTH
jgi:hypothetical protein